MTKLRINPSLLISMVALFVALGGVSYAAATIGSAQIKNNSVQSKDVKNGNLLGKDLKANTIGGSRVLESSLAQVPRRSPWVAAAMTPPVSRAPWRSCV